MPIVHLTGHCTESRLEGDRSLYEIKPAELAAILLQNVSDTTLEELTKALMKHLNIAEWTTQNILLAYCQMCRPRDYGDEPAQHM